jgi:hypothetical protein
LYHPPGQKASVMICVMICNALYDILINRPLYAEQADYQSYGVQRFHLQPPLNDADEP